MQSQDAPADKRFEYEFVCDDSLEEQAQLPPNVQMQIYRMVQEAVSNIWRHAGATQVKMTVARRMATSCCNFRTTARISIRLFRKIWKDAASPTCARAQA